MPDDDDVLVECVWIEVPKEAYLPLRQHLVKRDDFVVFSSYSGGIGLNDEGVMWTDWGLTSASMPMLRERRARAGEPWRYWVSAIAISGYCEKEWG